MSRVSEQSTGTFRPILGGWHIRALSAVAMLAGPGFFAFALLTALYRDIPRNAPGQQGADVLTVDLDRMAGRLLSPVSERIAPTLGQASQREAAGASAKNPAKTFLKITGAPDYSAKSATPVALDAASKETFRTVCVRLCDGSYFQIGYAATQDQFAAHEAQCQSDCGSPARLYVYANGTETPLQMRSLAGHAYLELDTAFRFQAKYDARCGCRPKPWSIASRQRHQRYAVLAAGGKQGQLARAGTAVAGATTPVELFEVVTPASLADMTRSRTIDDRMPEIVFASSFITSNVTVRAANKSEIARLEVDQIRTDRIAAISERTEFIATLELPSFGSTTASSSLNRNQLAAARELKQLAPFSLVSFAPASGPYQKAQNDGVKVAELIAGPDGRGQPSATDILMRNLNPHY